jgi:hypothetical protein
LVALTVNPGRPLAIVNGSAADVPPPGVGEKTVICAVPTVVRSLAGTAVCSNVLLTKVVRRTAPFQRIVEVFTKPLPLTLRVNAALPTAAVDGDNEPIDGTGLLLTTVIVGLVAAGV